MANHFIIIFFITSGFGFQMHAQDMLLSEFISKEPGAPVLVLFGGSPVKRNAVIRSLSENRKLTIYGTLSEKEGMAQILKLPKVDLVLIGGRYSDEQRKRIKEWLHKNRPGLPVTEPGVDYPYEEGVIKSEVYKLLKLNQL